MIKFGYVRAAKLGRTPVRVEVLWRNVCGELGFGRATRSKCYLSDVVLITRRRRGHSYASGGMRGVVGS